MFQSNFWKLLLGLVFACGLQIPAIASAHDDTAANGQQQELNVGDRAPHVQGVDDHGDRWNITEHLGKKYLVIYFYPADFTVGCSKQAASFRDRRNQLMEHDVDVIGISGDSTRNHELFKREWNLNFTLLSDECAEIAHDFGVPVRHGGRAVARRPNGNFLLDDKGERIILHREVTFLRWMYVIGKDGEIIYKNKNVRPAQASDQVLNFLDQQSEK